MEFLHTARLALTPLSPIHIGCGEDFDPTNYLIEGETLFGFDASRARLPDQLATRLGELGTKADLLGIQRFFREQREHFKPHAQLLIPVAAGVAHEYEQRVGRVANREANGKSVVNQLFIERASHSNGRPYIPGSSLKGALRTAIVDDLNAGKPPLASEKGRLPNSWDSAKIEKRLLLGDFASSPLRLVKPADLMPVGEVTRQVLYAINQKKERVLDREGNERPPRGVPSRKECILPGQYRAFAGALTLHHLGSHGTPGNAPVERLRPLSLARIARETNDYHLPRLSAELQMLDRRGFVDPHWKGAVEKLLAGETRAALDEGRAFLVRLGRHGGAECKTLSGEGVAQIKILQVNNAEGRRNPPVFLSYTKTVWLAGKDARDRRHLLPFGWALVEIDPQEDLAELRAWCDRQAQSRPDMASIRAGFAEARAVAEQQAEQLRAASAAALAAEKERLAQEAERARRKEALGPEMREIDEFVDAYRQRADQLRGGKDKPNTAYHQRAQRLAESAANWGANETRAAVAAIEEWLPKVVTIDLKSLRRTPWLAALRTRAQG
ncbi:MAG TPA: type III-A CRISPR-associated RAMP protein Csm5 [Candidatus Accumulibacter phosphatis]|nr:MAG: CRISPR type III-A [Candidatus Accumulibacter sp. SK-11]HAY28292.1 type III-A CRISPR-associated RAMP protein Csm5 [Accumulibacter sp.]HCN67072.1 type III-A CRISPR-associated RAMP protein Csm5 [Accumulibacter sp.]HRL76685.1 type III-A CRISPR-associated RAMP protein Csm5 [Candidatus Accumulibacter phosphatis]HRQ96812.1 type III-A CRISPR-associated RAMP protein Csm5 [Candidatus Accumulibacter phosphatis]